MINKRGQFFGVYLFVLTLFMCSLSYSFYSYQEDKVQNSIISPFDLLKLQDAQELFEIKEASLIKDIVCNYKTSGIDVVKIKSEITSGMDDDFLFPNSVSNRDGLLDSFYSVNNNGREIIILRIVKPSHWNKVLPPVDPKSKNNFPVKLEWTLEKTYNINLDEDC